MTVGELVSLLQDIEDQDLRVMIPSELDMSGFADPIYVDVIGNYEIGSYVLIQEP